MCLLVAFENFLGSNKPFALKMAAGVRDCLMFPVNYSNNCLLQGQTSHANTYCVWRPAMFNGKACATDRRTIRCSLTD